MFTKYFLMGGKCHGGQYPNQEWYQKMLFLSTYWEGLSCIFLCSYDNLSALWQGIND